VTHLRYMELRTGGPTITREDHERLQTFVPRPRAMCYFVWLALREWRSW
jgi:hypothetical protein